MRAHYGLNLRQIFSPTLPRTAFGIFAEDGRFDLACYSEPFARELILFEEPDGDVIAWDMETDAVASYGGAFCLGSEVLANPSAIMLSARLHIFSSVWTWLHYRSDGIVVLDWSRAWHRLSGLPRIAVTPAVLVKYRKHMVPPRLPELYVCPLDEMLPEVA